MDDGNDHEQRKFDADSRAEREFGMIMFVLAGVLAAIIVAALAYGIFFNSSDVARSIPSPHHAQRMRTATPNSASNSNGVTTDGSGSFTPHPSRTP